MSHGYGQVTITGRHDGGMDTVSIHDAGMGIAAEDRQRIFEPLFPQKFNGHGLGLTICRQMVESHGGTIELAEKGVPGTTLVLQFPRKIIKVGA